MRSWRGLLLLLVTTLLLAAEPWMNSYQLAMTAVQKNEWKTAVEHLEKAIAAKPKEESFTKLRSGSGPYLPHYWLGTALLQLGEKEKGAQALRQSESQGAIQKTAHYAELRNALAKLERERGSSDVEALSTARATTDRSLTLAIAAKAKATAAGGARTETYRRAAQKLQEAFDLKKAGDAASISRAAAAAKEAAELFTSVADSAKKQPGVAKQDPQPAKPIVDPNPAPAEQPAPAISKVAAQRELKELEEELAVARRSRSSKQLSSSSATATDLLASWESSLAAARTQNDVDAIQRGAAQQRAELRRLMAEAQKDAPAVPAVPKQPQLEPRDEPSPSRPGSTPLPPLRTELLEAYILLARGDLDRAEQATSGIITRAQSFEAYMLRGCTRYTRAQLTNQKEFERAAAADFLAALKLNPTAKLDERAFSPKLVSFFEQVQGR